MSTVIGLAIASDELRALAVRDGRVHWAARAGRTEEPALSAQIAALLGQAPVSRWQRPSVVAAIGPGAAQLKLITGLPRLANSAALGALVRESTARFFLRNGIPLEIAGVRTAPVGVWAAAFERPVVAGIAEGCAAAKFRLRSIVPAVDVLGAGLGNGHAVWRDGEVLAELVFESGTLVSVRRLASGAAADGEPPRPAEALASLGDEGWRFADAYGAALVPPSAALALRSGAQSDEAVSRRRVSIAAAACAVAALVALVAPGAYGVLDEARAERQLAAIAPQARSAAAVEQELRRMSAALAQVGVFASQRRSPTLLLAGLSRALPPGAALITLRIDSAGGTLVLLAPRAARAIAALDSVPGITAPEIVGPVTKEVVGLREVERATVRFRLAGGSPR